MGHREPAYLDFSVRTSVERYGTVYDPPLSHDELEQIRRDRAWLQLVVGPHRCLLLSDEEQRFSAWVLSVYAANRFRVERHMRREKARRTTFAN